MRQCYDLSVSPATHDFVNWLARIEQRRVAKGQSAIDVVIVPGDRRKTPRDLFYSQDQKMWRAHNLLFPLARCLPSVASVAFGRGIQTEDYINFPQPQPPVLKAPAHAAQLVRAFLRDRPRPVSVTLRQSAFEPTRNSNVETWELVCERLQANGYSPVIVPDAEALMTGTSAMFEYVRTSFCAYPAASLHPELLLALYEQCEANLMTNNGRMVMALFAECALMAWKIIIAGLPCCNEPHVRISAMAEDDDWGPRKHLYWVDDDYDEIIARIKPVLFERKKDVMYA
jgi:hypothetical protein